VRVYQSPRHHTALLAVVTLLWLPTGGLFPALRQSPLLARGVADSWGRRWNLWFSDWFRFTILGPLRRRPVLAIMLVFLVSGFAHEWVVNGMQRRSMLLWWRRMDGSQSDQVTVAVGFNPRNPHPP
jgi:hypothetical protein